MFVIPQPWIEFLSGYAGVLQIFAVVVTVLLALSAVDDLFVDVCFWVRQAWRSLFVHPRHARLQEQALLDRAEQPIAIMLPAWKEHDVIEVMVENAIRNLNYNDYRIFIGVYANDPETRAEVDRLTQRHRRVTRVDVPRDGPTSKADCLNFIVADIFKAEAAMGRPFAGVVLHDCEDVLHPLELKFFNYLLPRKDLIQLPVVSLERGYGELLAGTYMDEFAEWHAKDLVVREAVAQAVPSAGVGTCFSRRALEVLTSDSEGGPFNTLTLTEDYDIGARLSKAGLTSIMARFPVAFRVTRRRFFGLGPKYQTTLVMPLCVREYFPNTFRASYRQKARWTLGIAIQGWTQLGWAPTLTSNYFLFRDRKALISPSLGMAAYLVVINYGLLILTTWLIRMEPLPLFPDWPWVHALLAFNLFALGLRAVQRVFFVSRIYGLGHGVMSLPRMVVGTVVNFAASVRAIRLYAGHLMFGRKIVWDKTDHEFPSDAVLAHDRRRLGEILTTWQAISEAELTQALEDQKQQTGPLGRMLLRQGRLDEETLAEAMSVQTGLGRARFTSDQVRDSAAMLPIALCVRSRVLPLGDNAKGQAMVASAGPLGDEQLEALRKALGRAPLIVIAREGEIADGLRILRGGDGGGSTAPLIGDVLLDQKSVEPAAFERAMAVYEPDRHGRVGEYLIALGVVTAEKLAAALDMQRTASNVVLVAMVPA